MQPEVCLIRIAVEEAGRPSVPARKIQQVREHLLDLARGGEAGKRGNQHEQTNQMRPGTAHRAGISGRSGKDNRKSGEDRDWAWIMKFERKSRINGWFGEELSQEEGRWQGYWWYWRRERVQALSVV